MNPCKFLKEIQHTELRTNHLVTNSARRAGLRIPKGFRPSAQGCDAGATLGQRPTSLPNCNAVAAIPVSPVAPHVWDWPDCRRVNPNADFSNDAGSVSPSPWGEGRDEGGRETNFPAGVTSHQSLAQFRWITRVMPDGKHFDFAVFRADGEIYRVRPWWRHSGFVRRSCEETKAFRVLGQSLQKSPKRIIESQANAKLAVFVPVNSLIPFPFRVSLRNDLERHFWARMRALISAETSSIGVPRPGCLSASSARRSSSAICSGVSWPLKSPNSKSMVSTSSRRSASGIWRSSSRISVLLMVEIYSFDLPAQAKCPNPVGVGDIPLSSTQGSSYLATLGWMIQSLWDWPNGFAQAGYSGSRITHHASLSASRHP